MEAALHPWPALGALLLRDGLVTREQLESVLADQRDSPHQRISGKRLGESLVEQGLVTRTQVAQLVAEQYSLPFVELTESEVGIRAAVLVSEDLARRTSALPISVLPDNSVLVAVADPALALFSDELHAALGVPLRFAVTTGEAMDAAITYAFERAKLLVLATEPVPVEPAEEEYETDPVDELIVEAEPDRVGESSAAPPTLTRPWPVLGAMLIRDDLVSEEDLDAALAQQRVSGSRRLGEILVDRGAVSPSDIARLVAEQYELTFVDLDASDVDLEVASQLPEEVATRYSAIPVAMRDGEVLLALGDPTRVLDAHELRTAFTSPVRFVAAAPHAIEQAITRAYAAPAPAPADSEATRDAVIADDEGTPQASEAIGALDDEVDVTMADYLLEATASVLRSDDATAGKGTETTEYEEAVELEPEPEPELEPEPERETTVIVAESVATTAEASNEALARVTDVLTTLGASHVHLSPAGDGLIVRARIDGVARDVRTLSAGDALETLHAVKNLAGLEPEPRRTPYECGVRYPASELELDVRLAVVPTVAGEKLTLTVRDAGTTTHELGALGFQPDAVELLREALARPTGAVVFCGPAGSGRTTTLYAALAELDTRERTIATIEHPVEHVLPGIDQVEVWPSAGLTFGRALQAVVRSDSDVVAIGELTDPEIARASLGAATSRLVLATLEASSAAAALRRLRPVDAGQFDEELAHALTLVVSQRLVRRICADCRETYYADADELAELGRPSDETGRRLLARGRGCPTCGDTGYRGRVGVFEVLAPTAEIRTLTAAGAPVEELQRAATTAGMPDLSGEGMNLCLDGVTTVTELRRVLGRTA
jgi:type IV pilus assembly protein PilB